MFTRYHDEFDTELYPMYRQAVLYHGVENAQYLVEFFDRDHQGRITYEHTALNEVDANVPDGYQRD